MSAGQSEPREVSPLELFYDLVFVFAISQLSHHLLDDVTWRGAAETLVLLCAVFTVWVQTTFEATYFDITRRQTQTGILIAMALGLYMNAAIGAAFDNGGWAFAVPLVVTQLARGVLTATFAPTAPLRQHYRRALTWMLASAPLWVIGCAVSSELRLWVWGAAAAIDVTGIWLAHPWPHSRMDSREIAFDDAHMTERLRLFLIIALGEAILTTGTAISDAPTDAPTLIAGAGGFALVAALWAPTSGDHRASSSEAPFGEPIRSGRRVWAPTGSTSCSPVWSPPPSAARSSSATRSTVAHSRSGSSSAAARCCTSPPRRGSFTSPRTGHSSADGPDASSSPWRYPWLRCSRSSPPSESSPSRSSLSPRSPHATGTQPPTPAIQGLRHLGGAPCAEVPTSDPLLRSAHLPLTQR
jgi:hypothetical protein